MKEGGPKTIISCIYLTFCISIKFLILLFNLFTMFSLFLLYSFSHIISTLLFDLIKSKIFLLSLSHICFAVFFETGLKKSLLYKNGSACQKQPLNSITNLNSFIKISTL